MFCDRCGTELQPNQNFCPKCGKGLETGAPVPTRSRIGSHLRLLGILWLAISGIRLIPGIVLVTIFRPDVQFLPPDVPPFVPDLIHGMGVLFIGGAVLGIITGWGLLQRQSWARMLAIVFGCFSLLDIPLGTALGIYTLWVLLPANSEEEYRQVASAA
jgi:zinc ribbon protein